jgi:hypothetical protein
MHQLTITIGRGIGDTPMSDDDWTAFQGAIETTARRVFGTVLAEKTHLGWFHGTGEWQGVVEESVTYLLLIDIAPSFGDWLRDHCERSLAPALRIAAGIWSQDAIAYSLGESFLAERRDYRPSDVDALS